MHLIQLAPDQVWETTDVHVDYSEFKFPSVTDAIAMSARDPLSTVLHYDVAVRVLLAWVKGSTNVLTLSRLQQRQNLHTE